MNDSNHFVENRLSKFKTGSLRDYITLRRSTSLPILWRIKGELKGYHGDKERLFSTISNPLPRFHRCAPRVDYGAMHHLVSEATVRRSPLPILLSFPLPFSSPSPNVLSFCNKRTRKKRPVGVRLTPSWQIPRTYKSNLANKSLRRFYERLWFQTFFLPLFLPSCSHCSILNRLFVHLPTSPLFLPTSVGLIPDIYIYIISSPFFRWIFLQRYSNFLLQLFRTGQVFGLLTGENYRLFSSNRD